MQLGLAVPLFGEEEEEAGVFLLSDCLLLSQTLAKHVMSLHVSALTQTQAVEGEIELNKLKKLISFCRT